MQPFDPARLYPDKSSPLFPDIKARMVIPPELRARSAASEMRVTSTIVLHAIGQLLIGQTRLLQQVSTEGGVNDVALVSVIKDDECRLGVTDTLTASTKHQTGILPLHVVLLTLGAAFSHHLFPEVSAAWQDVVDRAGHLGLSLPMTERQLENAKLLRNDLIRLSDTLSYAIQTTTIDIGHHSFTADGEDVTPNLLHGSAFPQPPMPTFDGPASSVLSDLKRWVRRGVNVFLTGPTGTFKTSTANQAALINRANLFSVQGRPGLEDRDFYGGVYPVPGKEPTWIAGPVAQAFDSAASGALTVLVFNEVTRFEPLYFNATIGMMDEYSGAELAAHGVTFTPEHLKAVGLSSQNEGRYYLLTLPNGESIACRKELLCFVGTANLGTDYVTTGELDAALLRRYERHVEMTFPDESVVMPLLIQAAGDAHLAEVAYRLEVFTRPQVVDDLGFSEEMSAEGLLKRAMNFSTTRTLLDEARELVESGVPARSAFIRAAQSTVVPYCVPRLPSGTLDPAARTRLEDDVMKHSLQLSE
jgi:hypothetical protein